MILLRVWEHDSARAIGGTHHTTGTRGLTPLLPSHTRYVHPTPCKIPHDETSTANREVLQWPICSGTTDWFEQERSRLTMIAKLIFEPCTFSAPFNREKAIVHFHLLFRCVRNVSAVLWGKSFHNTYTNSHTQTCSYAELFGFLSSRCWLLQRLERSIQHAPEEERCQSCTFENHSRWS